MVKFVGVPRQPFDFGVTVIVAITGAKLVFMVLKLAMLPFPDAARPMDGVSLVQSNVVLETFPEKLMAPLAVPLHLTKLVIGFTLGFGLTVMVKVLAVPVQVFATGVTVMVATIGVNPGLVAVNGRIEFVPEAGIPILALLDVQWYVDPETDPEKSI